MGVKPGVRLEVLRRGRPGGILHLTCGALEFMLRLEHASELTDTIDKGIGIMPRQRAQAERIGGDHTLCSHAERAAKMK
jgi:hypothetical protein